MEEELLSLFIFLALFFLLSGCALLWIAHVLEKRD